jgi:hypothetical protein
MEYSDESTVELSAAEQLFDSWHSFLYVAKLWDFLVGKVMLGNFVWNVFVGGTGLTFLEYKNL